MPDLVNGIPLLDGSAPPYPCVIVGEAPGKEEHVTGRPFVGYAGKFLRQELDGLLTAEAKEKIFLTNAFRHWPVCSDRVATPTPAMVRSHRPRLRDELSMCEPRAILVLGRVALFAVTDNADYHPDTPGHPMKDLVGTEDSRKRNYTPSPGLITSNTKVEVIAIHHPRYMAAQKKRNPSLYDDWRSHIRRWAAA